MSKRIFLIAAIIIISSCSKEPYDPDYNISLVVQNDSVTLYHHYRISKPGVSDFSFCDELPGADTSAQGRSPDEKRERDSELIVLDPVTFSTSDSAALLNYFESFRKQESDMIKEGIMGWIGSQTINIEIADTALFFPFFKFYRWVETGYGSGFSRTGRGLHCKINGIQPYHHT